LGFYEARMVAFRHPVVDVSPASCGAMAVAAIVGTRVSTAMAALVRADAAVWSTNAVDLAGAFDRFGLKLWQVEGYHDPCPPLADWLADREPFLRVTPAAILAEERGRPRHWISVRGGWVNDGQSSSGESALPRLSEWVRIEDACLGRWSVRAAFAVSPY
jgi:hypothetical protein